jgi:hypothetical protein
MTTGALLLSLSSLPSGTALQHLQNIISGGGITWMPAQSISADMSQITLSADFIAQTVSADITIQAVNANISQPICSADMI